MKKTLLTLCLIVFALTARAHDHAEVRRDAGTPSRLAIVGNTAVFATYFPLGELPSGFLPQFPGSAFACEYTFSAFENTALPPGGATVRIDILSVTGPAGGSFSFWEVNATTPTITRPSGWTAGGADQPSFFVSEEGNGYGHIHGRVFTTDKSGVFQVTFRAVDTTGHYTAGNPYVVQFTALQPPQLAISKVSTNMRLTFTSRPDLVYDLQSSTTLKPYEWTTIDTLDGTGGTLQFTDPIAARPAGFYRLVEYQ